MGKRSVVIDIEANGLAPTIIWCVVCLDIETEEVFKFYPKNPYTGHNDWKEEFINFLTNECNTLIGHNLLGYDVYWINKILGTDIKVSQVEDTLVMSRLFRPVTPFKERQPFLKSDTRLGGHGLEAWGDRLGYHKIQFNNFEYFSQEMLDYCERDVRLNFLVYKKLLTEGKGFSKQSIRLEHKVAWLLAQQERNGFYLDKKAAKDLYNTCTEILDEMMVKLQEVFPPIPKLVREYEVKYNKDGSLSAVSKRILDSYVNNPELSIEKTDKDKYNLYALQTFNPKSSKQIGERLLSLGWNPRKFTPKGNPATDKETLEEAVEELLGLNPGLDALNYLSNFNIVADRQQKAEKWLELVEEDECVHGRINPIGAGTHRCSHYADNMANIARVITDKDGNPIKGLEGKFGWDSRQCWSVRSSDNVLVGADASGIQLRALAHYMNDPEYTKKLLEDDIHTVHQLAAGIDTRAKAKTFIYAWLLGAGDEKIGTIVGVLDSEIYELLFVYGRSKIVWNKPLTEYVIDKLRSQNRPATQRLVATIIKGYKIKEQFLDRTPALKRLKTEDIPNATKQGYLVGLDGRKFWIPNEHLAMSMYLQGFEAVIMKAAMCFYHDELNGIGVPFKQVAFIHDEFQIETKKEYGDIVGKAVVNAIKKAGEVFNSNCPLDGEYKIGLNWAETH